MHFDAQRDKKLMLASFGGKLDKISSIGILKPIEIQSVRNFNLLSKIQWTLNPKRGVKSLFIDQCRIECNKIFKHWSSNICKDIKNDNL